MSENYEAMENGTNNEEVESSTGNIITNIISGIAGAVGGSAITRPKVIKEAAEAIGMDPKDLNELMKKEKKVKEPKKGGLGIRNPFYRKEPDKPAESNEKKEEPKPEPKPKRTRKRKSE